VAATVSAAPWNRLTDLGLAVALLCLFPLAGVVSGVSRALNTPLCAFRLISGRPCPFCGLTRAFAMAWAGRWEEAFTLHPLWPVAAGIVLLMAGLFAIDAGRRGRRARDFAQALMRWWMIPAALLLIFEVIRLWG